MTHFLETLYVKPMKMGIFFFFGKRFTALKYLIKQNNKDGLTIIGCPNQNGPRAYKIGLT